MGTEGNTTSYEAVGEVFVGLQRRPSSRECFDQELIQHERIVARVYFARVGNCDENVLLLHRFVSPW